MADVLQALGSAGAPDKVDVLSALNAAQDDAQQKIDPSKAPGAGESFAQGIGDTFIGLGRLTQHILPDAGLNLVRKVLGFNEVSTQDWDKIATKREQNYQQARAESGENGIDWWRIGGNVANPVNYLGVAAKAAPTVLGRIAQTAAQSGAQAAVQGSAESTTPDSYWWDTIKSGAIGTAAGSAFGGLVEAVAPVLRAATNAVRKIVGNDAQTAAPGAADAVVKKTLQTAGVDPSTVNMPLLTGMRQDVQSALEHGADISPQAIVNRARAESLPVPVQLTRGQATGDAMQYAKELNLRGVQGVGEPMTQRLTEQNQAFIANLDALGAKNAPSPIDTGNAYAGKVQQFWDGLQQRKDQLYESVRNNQGQSAAMDGIGAAKAIKAKFDSPAESHIWNSLPANIRQTIDDIGDGTFPMTVAQAQSLDKQWGRAAIGANGDVAHALNEARSMLLNAPITDSVGQEAKVAYQAAKAAHAQQMSLLDPKLPNGMPNPNFQPLVKSVVQDGKPPEQLFDKHFMNAAPSVAAKNLQFLSRLDPEAPKQIGQTFIGEVKRSALNSSSDERGIISEAAMRGWANDPVKSTRMEALMPKPAVDTFRNLASTVEAAKKIPVASAVNTSNTGSSLVNAGTSMLKQNAVAQATKRLPILRDIIGGIQEANQQTAAKEALTPGVTLKSLTSSTPAQAARNRLISGVAATPLTSEQVNNGPNN